MAASPELCRLTLGFGRQTPDAKHSGKCTKGNLEAEIATNLFLRVPYTYICCKGAQNPIPMIKAATFLTPYSNPYRPLKDTFK